MQIRFNAPPIHKAQQFLEQLLDAYFNQLKSKDKRWLFRKKSEQYQPWKLIKTDSLVISRLRRQEVAKLASPSDYLFD
jgi:hypothetical protein